MTGVSDDRMMAALSYLGVLVFIPIVTAKQNQFVNWHARQGLVVFVTTLAALIFSLWMARTGTIIFLIVAIFNIIALAKALQGRRWPIPLLGKISQNIRI